MLVVENTHENVVGTVHLVTNENVFVAKVFCSSVGCESCTLVASGGTKENICQPLRPLWSP